MGRELRQGQDLVAMPREGMTIFAVKSAPLVLFVPSVPFSGSVQSRLVKVGQPQAEPRLGRFKRSAGLRPGSLAAGLKQAGPEADALMSLRTAIMG